MRSAAAAAVLGIGLPAEPIGEQLTSLFVGQPGQPKALRPGCASQPGQPRRKGAARLRVLHPVGAHHHHRIGRGPLGQHREQRQTGLIRPVQVLQQQEQRAGRPALGDQELDHRLVQRRLGETRAVTRRLSTEDHPRRSIPRHGREIAEDLTPRPVRRLVARLLGSSFGHDHAGRPSSPGHLLRQSGLPDAGLAGQHPDPSVALRDAAHSLLQQGELPLPARAGHGPPVDPERPRAASGARGCGGSSGVRDGRKSRLESCCNS